MDNLDKIKIFNELLHKYLNALVQFAYVRCHDRQLAEDLVQEACLKAYKAFMSKNENEILKPKEWLFRILINTHISYARKKQVVFVEDFNLENIELLCDEAQESDLDLKKELLEEDLTEALSKLPTQQREIIYLVDIEGYTFKDATELLGIPFGTMTSRLHRGRLKLKTILIDLGYSKEYVKAGDRYGL